MSSGTGLGFQKGELRRRVPVSSYPFKVADPCFLSSGRLDWWPPFFAVRRNAVGTSASITGGADTAECDSSRSWGEPGHHQSLSPGSILKAELCRNRIAYADPIVTLPPACCALRTGRTQGENYTSTAVVASIALLPR
jgi:hypothetical protein